ncbi:unnamed protein product [Amoebophrya sp. A120]|nr:unnamed protein product [Amoebophrya sp. A120]|eukprot:GSA120T00017427001.1
MVMIDRTEPYRQRILGPGFARQTFIQQDAAARLSGFEFLLYVLTFLIWPLYYVSNRVRTGDAYEVNRVWSTSIKAATYVDQHGFSRRWENIQSLEDVEAFFTEALPKAVTAPSAANRVLTPLRISTRRMKMVANEDKDFKLLAPEVWGSMAGVSVHDETEEFDDLTHYGAYRSWRRSSFGDAGKQELQFNIFPNKVCIGGKELAHVVVGETLDTCKRLCGLYDCGCLLVPSDCANAGSDVCSYCKFRSYSKDDLTLSAPYYPTMPNYASELVPPTLVSNGRTIFLPSLNQFHRSTSHAVLPYGSKKQLAFVQLVEVTQRSSSETPAVEQLALVLKEVVKDGQFIDRYTSTVAVDFVSYNPNLRLHTWVQLIFTFNVAGSVSCEYQLDTLDLTGNAESVATDIGLGMYQADDKMTLAVLILWTVRVLFGGGNQKWTVWNYLMLLNIVLFYVVHTVWISYQSQDSALPDLNAFEQSSAVATGTTDALNAAGFSAMMEKFEKQAASFLLFQRIAGLAFFFQYVNLLSYLRIASVRVRILIDMVARSATALVCFTLFCTILFLGFVNFSNIQFGSRLTEFGTQSDAFVSLFEMMGGKVDVYDLLIVEYPVRSRIFFLIFMLLFYFILVNLNNAILNAAYVDAVNDAEAREALKRQSDLSSGEQGEEDDDDESEVGAQDKFNRWKSAVFLRAHTNVHAAADKAKRFLGFGVEEKDEEEEPQEDGLTTKVLYALFVVFYFVILYLQLQRSDTFHAGEPIKDALRYATFPSSTSGQRYATFDGIESRADVLRWLRTGLRYALFESSESLPGDDLSSASKFLDRYHTSIDGICEGNEPGERGCKQLVIRNWNVVLGQKPVRLTQRLFPMEATPYLTASASAASSSSSTSTTSAALLPSDLLYQRTSTVRDLSVQAEDVFADQVKKAADVVDVRQRLVLGNFTTGFNEQSAFVRSLSVHARLFDRDTRQMEELNYVSAQTANLVVEFLVFNAQLQIFSLAIVGFTFPPGGGVEKRITLKSLPVQYYTFDKTANVIRVLLEMIYLVYLAYYIIEEGVEVHAEFVEKKNRLLAEKLFDEGLLDDPANFVPVAPPKPQLVKLQDEHEDGGATSSKPPQFAEAAAAEVDPTHGIRLSITEYLKAGLQAFLHHFCMDLFNTVDLVSYILSITSILLWMRFSSDAFLAQYVQYENPTWEGCDIQSGWWCSDAEVMAAFFQAAKKQDLFVATAALNVVFIFFRLLKFFRTAGRMTVIFQSLAGGFKDISWFFLLFFVIFWGFVLAGNLFFGRYHKEFSNLSDGLLEVYEMILGNYAFSLLSAADPTMAPVFFFPFLMLFYYLLMNVFFAVMDKNFQHFDKEYTRELLDPLGTGGHLHSGGAAGEGFDLDDVNADLPRVELDQSAASASTVARPHKPPSPTSGRGHHQRSNKSPGGKSAASRRMMSRAIKEESIKNEVTPYWLLLPQEWRDWALETSTLILGDMHGTSTDEAAGGGAGADPTGLLTAYEVKEKEQNMMGQVASDLLEVSNLLDRYIDDVLPQLQEAQQNQNILAQYIEVQEERKLARKAQLEKLQGEYSRLLELSLAVGSNTVAKDE